MNWTYILLANVLIGLGVSLFMVLLRKNANFKLNRIWLLFVPVVSLVLPVLAQENTAAFTLELEAIMPALDPVAQVELQPVLDLPWAALLYGSGAFLLLLYYIRATWKIYRQFKGNPTDYVGDCKIYVHDSSANFSFFNYIALSKEAETQYHILEHELIHAQRRHTWDIYFFTVIQILFWFNPFVWVLKKLAAENHEFEADQETVKRTRFSGKQYAEALLQHNFEVGATSFIQPFKSESLTKKRIMMLFKKSNKWADTLRYTLAGAALVLAGLIFNPTTVQAQQKPGKDHVYTKEDKLDEKPAYPGGWEALYQYMGSKIKYPKDNAIDGTTFIRFVISKEGNVEQVSVKQGLRDDVDKQALQIIKEMPKWTPGKVDGKAVAVEMILPIKYATEK